MTYKEAAHYMGVKVSRLRSWVRERRIPFIRYGYRTHRFRRTDLDKFMEENTVKARPL